jgi:xanthine dehydrogenase accessory factor
MATLTARVSELLGARVPFVHATVVRAQQPTSARAGDDAIVLADGSMEGFVGGHCAAGSVRSAALAAMADGRAILLRVVPEDETGYPDVPGAAVVTNRCVSGGALEIFLEPKLPLPLVSVVGSSPIADALSAIGAPAGFVVERSAGTAPPAGAVAVIVASLGEDEATPIRAALDAGIGYVGLVAGRRRGAAVLDGLGLTDAERARVHTPVGLDIGAVGAEEIALSILAGLVKAIRHDGLRAPVTAGGTAEVQAIDPVCGMTVVAGPGTPSLVVGGETFWFCSTGCRDAYAATHREGH